MRIVSLLALVIFFPIFAHASVVITEIMYDPEGSDTDREWVELHNNGSESITIIGGSGNNTWRFYEVHSSGPHNHTFSDESYQDTLTLTPDKYAVVVQNGDVFKANYPDYTGTIIVSSAFSLSNASQTIGLRIGSNGPVWSEVVYDANVMGGKGDGKSLQFIGNSWVAAAPTPGAANVSAPGTSFNGTPSDISPDSAAPNATAVTAPSSLSSSPPEYLPIPTLHIVVGPDRIVSAGADTAFTAVVYDGKGNKRNDAMVTWSFGDGMRRTGASVFHSYYDPGEYAVVVRAATPDGGDVANEILISVKDVRIKIASVSPRGIILGNSDSRTLDLSLWRLLAGGQEFKIPVDTKILAGRSILFPSQVTGLPASGAAFLLYPSGEMAASYPEIPATVVAPLTQPSVLKTSSNKVQVIESVINTKKNIQTYEEAVLAPTAATEIAAVGAAFLASSSFEQELSSAADSRVSGIFSSPWTLGFLGVVVLASTAFIFS